MNGRVPLWKAFVVRWGLRLLGATWRISRAAPPECAPIIDGTSPAVIAFWHGSMLPVWYRFRSGKHAALVSGSADGELLAGYLERALGYGRVIRGSSSRGGADALDAMVAALAGSSCLITPDGPRGPRHVAKPGALVAARRSEVPVMLVGWWCRKKITLGSWDRMEVPLPFSRVHFRYCIFAMSGNDQGRVTDAELDRFGAKLSTLNAPDAARRSPAGGDSREGVE